ncbi:hypothetical protein [Streptomyces sp. NPDC012888]|uniref:hypothetical protein n=1 Tax=Streptomyces sp. NPDC012888 TaxID=3364855 RepID=UPI0036B37320
MPRSDLPFPPPPAYLRARPDGETPHEDRERALAELARAGIGPGRLLLLWALAAVFALGWSFVGMARLSFDEGDRLGVLIGVAFGVLGLGVLVPAGFWLVWGVRRDREVRRLLDAWARSGPRPADPALVARLRAPGRCLLWLLSSLALCAVGVWTASGFAAAAGPGLVTYDRAAYCAGLGTIWWVTGVLGAARAAAHHRWARSALTRSAAPATAAPDHRSASTGHPPPGSG